MPYDPIADATLDEFVEETRNFNQLVEAFMTQVPSFATADGLAALRENDGFFGSAEVDRVECRDLPGPVVPIPARQLVPDRVDAVVLDLHGGGWCIGSAASGDAANWELAQAANVAVLSIDYRLAPEHPFPAGPDDCQAAAEWLLEHAIGEFGTDRLLIAGSSAGAHLAALTLLRLRDRHGAAAVDRFLGANLLFGAYDLGMTPSQRTAHDALVIPRSMLEACFAHALPGLDADARRDPQHSPLYADLRDLVPALFTVGTLDPLLDDSLFMAARWAGAGNETDLRVYPESVHGFPAFPTEMGRAARAHMQAWIAGRVAASTAASSS